MLKTQTQASNVTFVVRMSRRPDGTVTGVVERVKTGVKQRFEGCDGLSALVARMLEDEDRHPLGEP